MRHRKQETGSRKSKDGRKRRGGFSLVEVLLAIFILGIGMIMVASVFPVGANWTREVAEESVAQTVAQDAQTIIRRHYGVGGDLRSYLAPDYLAGPGVPNANNHNSILQNAAITPFALQALPGFITDGASPGIPPSERAYQFGSNNPFPASDWTRCTYFWSALARLSPAHRDPGGPAADGTNGIIPSSSYTYDVYILVFRKGAVEHTFSPNGAEVPGLRDNNWGPGAALVPSLWAMNYSVGNYNAGGSPSVINALPPMGNYGIGLVSGTVFRQVVDTSGSNPQAMPRPMIISNPSVEPVIFSPAADGNVNSASPLIYVYQTTISF